MAIEETYKELLLDKIIREILAEAKDPTVSEITNRLNDFLEDNDVSKPLFKASDFKVSPGEASSVTKYNSTNDTVQQDLKVAYNHLLKTTEKSIITFDRWRAEGSLLEAQLVDLEERITSLLLLTEDTDGYFSFVQDHFVDASKIDLENTTALLDSKRHLVSIGSSSTAATRIDLTDLSEKNIEFNVLTKDILVSTISAPGSALKNAFADVNSFWQERVYVNKPSPVSVELKVQLASSPIAITKIDVDLHTSNSNSNIQVTPLYSTDNFNYKQLPISSFTRSIVDKTTFVFPELEAKWVKLILTKTGPDAVHNNLYCYEFGADEIVFYKETFTEETEYQLVSQPLSVTKSNGLPQEFNKLTLETCEDVPSNTSIQYYIAVSNDPVFSVGSATWIAIDPLNRETRQNPIVLDIGEASSATVSGVAIAYNASDNDPQFTNPSKSFKYLSGIASSAATVVSGQASSVRYTFANSADRILNHQIASGVNVISSSLELWRNHNPKGSVTQVRDQINGWGFEEPYYKTTVKVDNSAGVDIDFGPEHVVIDGTKLNGKVNISKGAHTIKIHKNNWKAITGNISTLAGLKTADNLYPYNHRYLVEGWDYPDEWSSSEEKVYRGFDIVAEFFMQEVAPFDIISNIEKTDYSKFALDKDGADTVGLLNGIIADKPSSTVFLLKVDENNPDFLNEKFLIKLKSASTSYRYLRLKAVLETTDAAVTPSIDSYKIKIAN